MLHFTQDDRQFLDHVVDVVSDRMRCNDGYTPADEVRMSKVELLATSVGKTSGSAVVATGADCDDAEARSALHDIVALELAHWVPGASQRLIWRAARMLDLPTFPKPERDDCGPAAGDHALTADWVAGHFVLHCATCHRLFPYN